MCSVNSLDSCLCGALYASLLPAGLSALGQAGRDMGGRLTENDDDHSFVG